ncbi:MAG: hypothetical protein NTW73_03200 [Candidatus Parcubacteria bacterium]|nr:hypothetical protein [Candidatus Parcubacteria bacterium]
MENILENLEKISRFRGKAKYYADMAEKYEGAVVKLLEKGVSTGDPIRDLVFLEANSFNKHLEAFYRGIELRLYNQIGSHIVLLIKQEIMYEKRFEIKELFYLGVLTGETLLIDVGKKECCFPTNNCIVCENCEISSIRTYKNPLPLSWWWRHFNQRLLSTPGFKISIKIGKKEVGSWLGKEPDNKHFLALTEMRGSLK